MCASVSVCVVCVALFERSIVRSATLGPQTRGVSQAIVIAPSCEGCAAGALGVCQGCALGVPRGEGGQVNAAYGVRGYGRRGCGGRLSDVCSQQKPQASGNTNRVCSGGAAAVSSHHPAAACTHWRGHAALDAHCVLCGCAAVCGCVRLCQARSEGQAEGREAEGGGRRGEAEGREAGGREAEGRARREGHAEG